MADVNRFTEPLVPGTDYRLLESLPRGIRDTRTARKVSLARGTVGNSEEPANRGRRFISRDSGYANVGRIERRWLEAGENAS